MSTAITVSVTLALLLVSLAVFAELLFRVRGRRRRWVVDRADSLEALARGLNRLDEQRFLLHGVLRDEAAFVIVSSRPFPRWRLR